MNSGRHATFVWLAGRAGSHAKTQPPADELRVYRDLIRATGLLLSANGFVGPAVAVIAAQKFPGEVLSFELVQFIGGC